MEKKSSFLLQLVFGVCVLMFSLFLFVSLFGWTNMPSVFASKSFVELLLVLLGVIFIIEAVKNRHLPEKTARLIVGLIVLMFGALPLFHTLGMLRFLPVIIFLDVSPIVLCVLLFFSALYFVIDRILVLFY